MKYQTALLIGRFQPPHLGHIYLIKRALKNAQRLIIGIGSANIINDDNPLDYETRKTLLKEIISKEKIYDQVIDIIPINDYYNDRLWLDNIKKQVKSFDLVVGNNDWTNNILSQAGYSVLPKKYYRRQIYEGWRVRQLIRQNKNWSARVPNYLISLINKYIVNNNLTIGLFNHVVLGGTFDQFHLGHQSLIDMAIKYGEKITIGLTTEKLYSHKVLSSMIEDYKTRKQRVVDYLTKKNCLNRVNIIPLNDIYGNTLTNPQIEAIVVSNLTFANALKINQQRVKNRQEELKIILIKDILATDGQIISSERIRLGEINPQGRCFDIVSQGKKQLIMPDRLRQQLQQPFGRLYKSIDKVVEVIKYTKSSMIMAVGDIVVESLINQGINPDLKIIDFKSRRQHLINLKSKVNKDNKAHINIPGTINLKTVTALKDSIRSIITNKNNNSWFVVEGEEDLLALPVIIYVPLNSLVIYGLRDKGIIIIKVTDKEKDKALRLLKLFNKK